MLIALNYVTKSLCIVTDGDLVGKATDLFVECCGCYRPDYAGKTFKRSEFISKELITANFPLLLTASG